MSLKFTYTYNSGNMQYTVDTKSEQMSTKHYKQSCYQNTALLYLILGHLNQREIVQSLHSTAQKHLSNIC